MAAPRSKARRGKTPGGEYAVRCERGIVRIDLTQGDTKVQILLDPDDAYAFGDAIMRSYDEAVGIA